jgi:hypothetical protein
MIQSTSFKRDKTALATLWERNIALPFTRNSSALADSRLRNGHSLVIFRCKDIPVLSNSYRSLFEY